jgi:DNA repair protein RecO (recombination protein O)
MITNALHAWVIYKTWSGDTSARVLFFTKEHGLISCLYKGGRTPKKQALIQPFTPLWVTMNVKGNAYFVRQIELADAAISFQGSTLFAGLYVNELIYHALRPHDPHPSLYEAYVQTLKALTQTFQRHAIEAVLRRFEWNLLTASGYPMSLTHEAHTLEPIALNRAYRFVASEGFILDEQGVSGAHILALSQDRLDDPAVLNAAKKIMRQAIDHALDGKIIKTRALYRS